MITIAGINQLQQKLRTASKQVPDKTKFAIQAATYATLNEAQQNVPVDTGKLRQSGFAEITNRGFTGRVTFSEAYAPFVEFGTGTAVDVPEGWGDLAIQFKGKGIKQINLPARPYLIPAYRRQAQLLLERLKTILGENL